MSLQLERSSAEVEMDRNLKECHKRITLLWNIINLFSVSAENVAENLPVKANGLSSAILFPEV